jgi:hypothetical protein
VATRRQVTQPSLDGQCLRIICVTKRGGSFDKFGLCVRACVVFGRCFAAHAKYQVQFEGAEPGTVGTKRKLLLLQFVRAVNKL